MNPEQESVVRSTSNIVLHAPPGTGKTETLARRVQFLIENLGVDPIKILCVTHTKNAAQNMHDRLKQLLSSQAANRIQVSTIHSFATELIERDYRGFHLASAVDRERCIETVGGLREVFDHMDRCVDADPVLAFQSTYDAYERKLRADPSNFCKQKNKAGQPKATFARLLESLDRHRACVDKYREYRQLMREKRIYTYDHLLLDTLTLLRTDKHMCTRFTHILVDEYQDIGELQVAILRELKHATTKLMVAGDKKQSIFSFNGSIPTSFERFQHDYNTEEGDIDVSTLTHNYRSTPALVAAGEFVISNQVNHALLAAEEVGPLPVVRRYASQEAEACAVASEIDRMVREGQVQPRDVAVLFRKHLVGERIAAAMRHFNVPFRAAKSSDILKDPLIKSVHMFVRFLVSETSPCTTLGSASEGILYSLLHQKRFLGHNLSTMEIDRAWRNHRSHLREWATNDNEENAVAIAVRRVLSFLPLVHKKCPPSSLLAKMYTAFRPTNGLRVIRSLMQYCREAEEKDPGWSLENLLDVLEDCPRFGIAIQEVPPYGEIQEDENVVTLLTCHAAKSLGYPVVFVVDCGDRVWKTRITLIQKVVIGEEETEAETRRLFHVAVSRAKQELYLSYYGDRPSTYVEELVEAGLAKAEEPERVDEEAIMSVFASVVQDDEPDEVNTEEEEVLLPPISASLLLDIEECPRRVYYEKVERIELPGIRREPHHATKEGIQIHDALEKLHRHRLTSGSFAGFDASSRIPESRRQEFEKYVLSRMEDWEKEYQSGASVCMEETLHGLVGDVPIVGRLDRFVYFPEVGAGTVYDYKTGKKKNDVRIRTQAAFYAVLLSESLKLKNVDVIFDFLSDEEQQEAFSISDQEKDTLKQRIQQAYGKLMKRQRCKQETCSWCFWC